MEHIDKDKLTGTQQSSKLPGGTFFWTMSRPVCMCAGYLRAFVCVDRGEDQCSHLQASILTAQSSQTLHRTAGHLRLWEFYCKQVKTYTYPTVSTLFVSLLFLVRANTNVLIQDLFIPPDNARAFQIYLDFLCFPLKPGGLQLKHTFPSPPTRFLISCSSIVRYRRIRTQMQGVFKQGYLL